MFKLSPLIKEQYSMSLPKRLFFNLKTENKFYIPNSCTQMVFRFSIYKQKTKNEFHAPKRLIVF